MSSGLFSKALKGAGFSVTTSKEGIRSFKNEHDDRGYDGGYTDDNSGGRRGGGKANRRPWRGGGRGRGSYRGYRGGRSRGRGGRGSRGGRYQSADSQSETNDEDGDVNMADPTQTSNNRYKPYGSRPSYRQAGDKFQSGSGGDWNKITIPNGRNHDKEWLLKRLRSLCKASFEPVEFHFSQDNACFFVDDQQAADALRAISGTITVRDGSKLLILVRNCPPPKRTGNTANDNSSSVSTANNIDEEILKKCLDGRYDIATCSLDLSNFYHDQVLNENHCQGILSRTSLMTQIVKLIKEHCSQLKTLDLRDNRITHLDGLESLHEAAPQLTTLHLGENRIRHVSELRKLKHLKQLTSLILDGNPLCSNYSDKQSSYVSDVRNIFPKLVSLDNCQLPAHIGFDLPSTTSMPETKGSFIPEDLKATLVPFIKQYFEIYDSDNRQKLLDAYHDNAVFSLCALDQRRDRGNSSSPLHVYRKFSRNLKFLHDPTRRLELLKMSKLAVVAFLNELPSTKHDLDSFIVDVNMVKPSCIGFTVNGIFKEGDSGELRGFHRVFMAVPAATNLIAIVNDQLTIRNPTSAQYQQSQKSSGHQPAAIEPASILPSTTIPVQVPTNSIAPSTSNLTPQQQQMVEQFSTQSGMNISWSFKALSEYHWDYQKSAEVFQSLHSEGSIPAEAFVK